MTAARAAPASARQPLGRTGLLVSRLGFGAATIASLNTRHSRAEVQATLHAAVDAGINFFDTADIYGQGDSERLLGGLRRASAADLIIATKVGLDLAASQRAVRWLKPLLQPVLRRWPRARAQGIGLRRATQRHCGQPVELRRRVQASLQRLQMPVLDLLLLHSPPADWSERDELRQLLQNLQRDGLVRHCGVSVQGLADVPRWLAWPEVSCLQLPLRPMPGGVELPALAQAGLHAAQLRGVGVVARELLDGGALATHADAREQALRAVLAPGGATVALLGMGCRQHLRQNLAALERLP